MTASHSSGPLVVFGVAASGSSQGSNPEAGPSAFYQGMALLDPRNPYLPGITGVGKIIGFADSPLICLYDGVPTTLSTSNIAAAQIPVAATALTLASAGVAGVSVNIPLIPSGLTASTTVLGIEVGTPLGVSTTSGSKTVTFPNAMLANQFKVGDAVMIGSGAGSSLPLFTTVLTAATSAAGTTITVAANLGATLSNAAFARMATTTTSQPAVFFTAGAARLLDSNATLQRGLTFTSVGNDSAATVAIVGYDLYHTIIHETVTLANATTAVTLKTYKYIKSITPAGTLSGSNLSVGFNDTLGLPLRVDRFEHLTAYHNAALITATTGFTAAVTTTPTAATGDVRGTYALQSASDSTKRTSLWYRMPTYVMAGATPDNVVPLFGQVQF